MTREELSNLCAPLSIEDTKETLEHLGELIQCALGGIEREVLAINTAINMFSQVDRETYPPTVRIMRELGVVE